MYDAATWFFGSRRQGMRTGIRLLAVAAGVFLCALPARAGDVSGKWKAEFDTQVGPQKYTFDLKVEGEKLTGKAVFERMGGKGEADLQEGKVDGDQISFVEPLEMQGNQIRIEYTGTVKGDEIAFTRKVGEFATETFTATRVQD
jgi:hypothetical protein